MANEGAPAESNAGRTLPKRKRAVLERPAMRKKVQALILEGLSDGAVGRAVGVTHQAIHHFRNRHAAELAQAVAEIERRIEDAALAHVVNRVWDAQGDYDRLGAVIDARAQDTRYDEPGYATGMMVHQLKSVGGGENAQVVDEFKVDMAVVSERRMLRREVAEVLDQLPRSDANKVEVQIGVLVRYVDNGHRD